MGQIKNTTLYPIKQNPTLEDYIPITDSETVAKETKSLLLSNLFELFSTYISTPPPFSLNVGGELSGTLPNPTLVNSAVVNKILTGLPAFSDAGITASDTILQALAKLQGTNNAQDIDITNLQGSVTTLQGQIGALPSSLSGEVSGAFASTVVSNSAVIGKVLTGLPALTNTNILPTDTILQAFAKIQGQINYIFSVNNPINNASIGQVAFVSANLGDDATGEIGNATKSYKTVQAAVNSGAETIVIFNGAYREDITIPTDKFAVNFYLWNGVKINGNLVSNLDNLNIFGQDYNEISTTTSATVQGSVNGINVSIKNVRIAGQSSFAVPNGSLIHATLSLIAKDVYLTNDDFHSSYNRIFHVVNGAIELQNAKTNIISTSTTLRHIVAVFGQGTLKVTRNSDLRINTLCTPCCSIDAGFVDIDIDSSTLVSVNSNIEEFSGSGILNLKNSRFKTTKVSGTNTSIDNLNNGNANIRINASNNNAAIIQSCQFCADNNVSSGVNANLLIVAGSGIFGVQHNANMYSEATFAHAFSGTLAEGGLLTNTGNLGEFIRLI